MHLGWIGALLAGAIAATAQSRRAAVEVCRLRTGSVVELPPRMRPSYISVGPPPSPAEHRARYGAPTPVGGVGPRQKSARRRAKARRRAARAGGGA